MSDTMFDIDVRSCETAADAFAKWWSHAPRRDRDFTGRDQLDEVQFELRSIAEFCLRRYGYMLVGSTSDVEHEVIRWAVHQAGIPDTSPSCWVWPVTMVVTQYEIILEGPDHPTTVIWSSGE